MTPADLYRTCGAPAWRLEILQHYTGTADEERQRAFHAGGPADGQGTCRQPAPVRLRPV